ncbi:sugar phosphate isomerase/epimerase family protein [Terriglobus roseus]|uniref:Xylose isomerase-like TIM barrel n=1 Tax=Terriglobus roseus TaxID=392734 RepID=A0A1G7KPA1_9BACT|nr:sugar phosphate isomerase/epimerase [Terriglobus roseus]SDF38961.1 Xylose isomerase-like TIM barrel [Terriglobus roseus]
MSNDTGMTRRDVLKMGALAAGSLTYGRMAAATGKPVIRLGVCSYGFRKFGPDQVIQFMHQLKCPYLNVKDIHLPMTPLADVPRLAAHYREAGIQLTDAGAIYFRVDTDEDVRPKFEYLRAAGVKSFVGAPTHAVLPRVERFVKEYDIRMGLHNHGPHDIEWPSPFDVQKAIEPLDHRIGYCIDVGHTLRIGVDPVAAIRMAGKRLFDLHVRDLTSADEKAEAVAMGDGVMPTRQIFRALAEIEYPYYVDLELENHENDPMPDTLKSFAYMRKLIAELGYREG